MSAPAFFTSLLVVWAALYIAVPLWLTARGWVVSAGLVQVIGAFSPAIWQKVFWPNEAGNFYLLVMVLLPIPLCVLLYGVGFLLFRAVRFVVRARA